MVSEYWSMDLHLVTYIPVIRCCRRVPPLPRDGAVTRSAVESFFFSTSHHSLLAMVGLTQHQRCQQAEQSTNHPEIQIHTLSSLQGSHEIEVWNLVWATSSHGEIQERLSQHLDRSPDKRTMGGHDTLYTYQTIMIPWRSIPHN